MLKALIFDLDGTLGLTTVVTPSRWTVEQDFSAADLVLPSLEELDLARLGKLLGEAHAAA